MAKTIPTYFMDSPLPEKEEARGEFNSTSGSLPDSYRLLKNNGKNKKKRVEQIVPNKQDAQCIGNYNQQSKGYLCFLKTPL